MAYLPGDRPSTEEQVLANGRRLDSVEVRLDRVEVRLDRIEHTLDEVVIQQTTQFALAISTQIRTFVLSTIASVISAAGLAFVAARFV